MKKKGAARPNATTHREPKKKNKLLEQPYQIAQAVEQSSELIAMADREGKFVSANSSFLRILGYSKEELLGKLFHIALSANNPPALAQDLAAKMYEPSGWKGECLVRRHDGSDFMISLSVGPAKDNKGRVIGSFCIGHDISEQKRAAAALQQSEEQFRELAEHIHAVFFVSTPEPFAITYISPGYDQVWGRPRQHLYDRPTAWIESIHHEDQERVYGVLAESQQGLETYMEYRIVRPDGTIRWISNPAFPVRDSQGKLVRVVGIAEDITERIQKEQSLQEAYKKMNSALAESERMAQESAKLSELVDILQSCQNLEEAYKILQSVLETMLACQSGALCITSASRNIVEAVSTWGAVLGSDRTFRPDDCWGLRRGKVHKVWDADSPVSCAHVRGVPLGGYLCVPLAAQGETLGVLYLECVAPTANQSQESRVDQIETLSRMASAVGERISLAIANLRLRQILRGQSIRDPLTGLFNRRYMEESLEREFSRATRSNDSVALLMLDIDHFKRFNDTFGHQAGDKLLHAFGDLLSQRTRGQDVACRYGGEEFALILSGASLEAARKRAELLQEDVKRLIVEHAGQVLETVTVSIGVAASLGQAATAEELLRRADESLYRAKAEGRDRIVVEMN